MTTNGRPVIHTWCTYHCHDPADTFWLPDMARSRVYERMTE
jgi:hypothetical protein